MKRAKKVIKIERSAFENMNDIFEVEIHGIGKNTEVRSMWIARVLQGIWKVFNQQRLYVEKSTELEYKYY